MTGGGSAEPLVLAARDVHFRHRHGTVLRGVSCQVRGGEVVALLGPNGAGKSTLLRLMLGLIRPQSGLVTLGGQSLTALGQRRIARQIAYVPQSHAVPFPYSVRQMVAMGRLAANGLFASPKDQDRHWVDQGVQQMGLADLADRPCNELSGGERQRVLIARALAQESRILVLDEPTNGLDYGHQLNLLKRLRDLAGQGYGILLTSHHPDHARQVADRAILLKNGQVLAEGPPDQAISNDWVARLYDIVD